MCRKSATRSSHEGISDGHYIATNSEPGRIYWGYLVQPGGGDLYYSDYLQGSLKRNWADNMFAVVVGGQDLYSMYFVHKNPTVVGSILL